VSRKIRLLRLFLQETDCGMKRFTLALTFVMLASPAFAQERPKGAAELTGGWLGYVDEGTDNRGLIGAAVKFHPSPRVAVGPELVYVIGPHGDRDVILTGNVTVDLLNARVTPFVVAGGGLFHQSVNFGSFKYTSTEGAFTAGAGMKFNVTDRFYIAPEARIGWELHTRVSVAIGSRF
jgi:opacity protein-like surface antigen